MSQEIYHSNESNYIYVFFSLCTHCSYLFVDLICVQCSPVGISARVKGTHKLVVVNEAVTVHVEDVCHCVHLQGVGGKFYSGEV